MIAEAESRLFGIEKDIQKRDNALAIEPDFLITLNGNTYDEREATGSLLMEIAHTLESMESRQIGTYKGFDVVINKKFSDCTIQLCRNMKYLSDMSSSPSGNMVRLENLLSGLIVKWKFAGGFFHSFHNSITG